MNIEDVKIWLIAHGYATFTDAFAAARMNGSAVLELINGPYGFDLLVELLPLASAGDREKLIRDLREQSEQFRAVVGGSKEVVRCLSPGITASVTDSSGGHAVLCNINPSQGLVPRPNNFCGLDDVTSANKRPKLDSQFQIPTEYSTEIMAGLKKGELNVYE
ncbi:hypothetical protein EMCRGX_G017282 [Ephydatia muelleri]